LKSSKISSRRKTEIAVPQELKGLLVLARWKQAMVHWLFSTLSIKGEVKSNSSEG
jgi:hypothetical protein